MDGTEWPSTYDRDLDLHPHGVMSPADSIDPYRRLVANPLLAIGSFVAAILLIRFALEHRILLIFLASLVLLFTSCLFVQFHCLDCGSTGWLVRAGRHACPRLVARWRESRMGRWRFPGLRIQVIVWLHLLASLAGLLLILFAFSR